MPTTIPLRVTLRWLALDAIKPAHWPILASLLDEKECARAERLYFDRDRRAFIAAHALARATLSQCFDRPPRAWRFGAGAHGKPHIDDDALRFNLSHTRGLVAAAAAPIGDIGVDVEAIDPQGLSVEIVDRYFARCECAYLKTLDAESWTEAAYAFWTLKEAYIKAIGLGLSCPLDAFHFILEPLSLHFSPRIDDDARFWRIERFSPTKEHAMALAIKCAHPEAVQIDARAARVDALLI